VTVVGTPRCGVSARIAGAMSEFVPCHKGVMERIDIRCYATKKCEDVAW
jgi:hypothetical protein